VINIFSTLGPALLLQQKANKLVMNAVCTFSEWESLNAGKTLPGTQLVFCFCVHLVTQQARKGRSTKYWCPGKSLLQRRQAENREDSKWLLD